MNWFERQAAKLAWGRVQKKMPSIKRWIPLIGTFVLAASALLEAFGLGEAAKVLTTLGGIIGAHQASPVSAVEIAAAAGAITGVALKVYSEMRKAAASAVR